MTPGTPRRPVTKPIDLPDLIGPDGELDDEAVAAIEGSTTDGRLKRVEPRVEARVEPLPSAPPPTPTRIKVGVGGFGVLLVALDQFLKSHEEAVTVATEAAGPLIARLLPLWPVWLPLVALGWLVMNRWQEHQAHLRARDAAAAAAATRASRNSRAQLHVLQSVVIETKHVGAELGALRIDFGALSTRLDATDTRTHNDARELRHYVDGRFAAIDERLANVERHLVRPV